MPTGRRTATLHSMNGIVFDRLAFVDRLTSGGIAAAHARVHADAIDVAMRETVATKADIEALQTATKADIADVRNDIETLRAETRADISALRAETRADMDSLRKDFDLLRTDMKAELTTMDGSIRAEITEMKGSLRLVQWMLVVVVAAIVIPALGKLI